MQQGVVILRGQGGDFFHQLLQLRTVLAFQQGLRLGADLLMQLHELGLVPGADGGELLPTPKPAEGQGCLVQGFDGLNQLDVGGRGVLRLPELLRELLQ